ncbi:inositol monophosphatase family protein [Actinomadura madurae]|uniref:inositol monophosphatase family protein n=1 Tax=Actinomadura madurae TaxID=1993 RepID=UPI002026B69A|nr:inositol monophosphatase family protein [Actinomadura madurae]MCQ0004166.1 inositol monophosphatase [Actinomadura madurae]URN00523.1 inositol monophosphatase [Actinomadura madurae]URN02679.1 inositol monophosphatase [Actinomadura madurae]
MRPTTPAEALPVDLSEARRVAVEAAEAAGALLAAGVGGPLGVRAKGTGGDVVTELDTAAEDLILGLLRAAYPRHRIIAEESGVLDGAPGEDMVWLVDPLDGTNNVAIGMPVYAVGLALCWRAEPVLGVVHDPVSGRTWSAVRGWGARGPAGKPLTLPARPRPGRAKNPVLAWTQGHAVGPDDRTAFALRSSLERRCARMLQLWAPLVGWAMLARGDIDGIVGYLPEIVDLPAGALLAAEAGAELRRLDGSPYRLEIDRPASELGFVAARPDLLDRLLETAAEAGRHDGRPRVAGRPGLTG